MRKRCPLVLCELVEFVGTCVCNRLKEGKKINKLKWDNSHFTISLWCVNLFFYIRRKLKGLL